MAIESGMYLYPWEIDDHEAFKTGYAATGCTAMAPALSYHHGNALIARTGRFKAISEAALSFEPREEYGELKPRVHREAARAGTVQFLREWCAKTGRHFSGWTVLLHNSSQGAAHPGSCVENLFGDIYEHALCPSQPAVREYTRALLGDICKQFAPHSLMLESATVQPAQHGVHHEIANIGMTESLRWLWSLCFCPRCMAHAAEVNPALDPEKVRSQAKELVLRLANHDTNLNDDAQLSMILLENPGLYGYQCARQLAVRDFIGEASELLRKAGVEFRLVPSAVPFIIKKAFMEGMSFTATAGMADCLIPLVYGDGETYGLVKNTIRVFDAHTPVGMAVSLHPNRFPERGSFFNALTSAKAEGCETIYIYNYSLAPAGRLAWVAEVNKLLL